MKTQFRKVFYDRRDVRKDRKFRVHVNVSETDMKKTDGIIGRTNNF